MSKKYSLERIQKMETKDIISISNYHLLIPIIKKKGYINLDAGFEKENNINNFLNKDYNEVPFENNIFFETFDTEKFLDTEIESNIVLKLKKCMLIK